MSGTRSTTELLLQSKLYRPRIPGRLVQRQRLLEKLNKGSRRRLTLVSASAGYGKTTLVNSWLETVDAPNAWLSLDESDNSLEIFVAYVAAAVRRQYPDAVSNTWSLVNSPGLPEPPRLADIFLQELEALPGRLFLVLDDYHAVQDLSINSFMTRLLSWLPANVRLVLISRSDPPLALSRLRARRQLAEIRSEDLSFTNVEAAELLAQLLDDQTSDEVALLIRERTEGWPAGLRLAAVSLQESSSPETFARRFARSSHRLVSDYLVDEVLENLEEEQRLGLLRTSLLDQFCASLCDAISGPDAAEGIGRRFVDELWQSNLFVVALDDEGVWYRYHHLFRELLRTRLRNVFTEGDIYAIHLRASAWFSSECLTDEAIAHAVKGGDITGAVQIVREGFASVLETDDWVSLERWLGYLPPETLDLPEVQIMRAYIEHYRFRLELILPLVDAAEKGLVGNSTAFTPEDKSKYLGLINTLRAVVYDVSGFPAQGLQFAEKALQQLPSSLHAPYGLAEYHYHDTLRRTGQYEKALASMQMKLEGRQWDKPDARSLRLLMAMGMYHHAKGNVAGALAASRTMRDQAHKAENPIPLGWALYGFGWGHYELNELDKAEHHLLEVLKKRFQVHSRAAVECYVGLALTYLAQGNKEAARAQAQELREFLLDLGMAGQLLLADALELRVSLFDVAFVPTPGEVNLLSDQVGQMPVTALWSAPILMVVSAQLRLGRPESVDAALNLLSSYRATVEAIHSTRKLIEIGALETVVHAARGDMDAALSSLKEAVVLGESGGMLRSFMDCGRGLLPFLRQLSSEGIAPEYVARLQSALSNEEEAMHPQVSMIGQSSGQILLGYDSTIKASLTNRELDVLILLSKRLTNKEIASELSLSPHTIKRHSISLYQKLGVNNRREAVVRAHALGLISA